jgi:hypothetical protein
MKLYQFAVIYNPDTTKENLKDEKPAVIVPVTEVLAKDERQAQMLAARSIPESYVDKLESVEITVRPF